MKLIGVIPARYASTRMPGKPLADILGKPMIWWVYQEAKKCKKLDDVFIATDDERIAAAVRRFGGEVAMTRPDHVSGTDRVAEVAAGLDADLVLNVQGDEPEMDPENIDRLVQLMQAESDCRIATVAVPFPADRPTAGPGSPADPNCVKVVLNARGRAMYFSRALVPYPREAAGIPHDVTRWLLHLGLYGFRRQTLLSLSRLAPTPLETTEKLEQLRWLENSCEIAVAIGRRPSAGIDTPDDYDAFVRRWHARQGSSG